MDQKELNKIEQEIFESIKDEISDINSKEAKKLIEEKIRKRNYLVEDWNVMYAIQRIQKIFLEDRENIPKVKGLKVLYKKFVRNFWILLAIVLPLFLLVALTSAILFVDHLRGVVLFMILQGSFWGCFMGYYAYKFSNNKLVFVAVGAVTFFLSFSRGFLIIIFAIFFWVRWIKNKEIRKIKEKNISKV